MGAGGGVVTHGDQAVFIGVAVLANAAAVDALLVLVQYAVVAPAHQCTLVLYRCQALLVGGINRRRVAFHPPLGPYVVVLLKPPLREARVLKNRRISRVAVQHHFDMDQLLGCRVCVNVNRDQLTDCRVFRSEPYEDPGRLLIPYVYPQGFLGDVSTVVERHDPEEMASVTLYRQPDCIF